MIKKILLAIFVISTVILGTTTGIFGYLYFAKANDYSKLLSQALEDGVTAIETNASDKSDLNEDSVATKPILINFKDDALDINLDYPSSWKLSLDTEISEDFAYEPVYGRVIQNYTATLNKGTSRLIFKKILGAVDGFPNKIKPTELNYVEVTADLVRYKQTDEAIWNYVQLLNCSDFEGELFSEPAAVDEVCVSPFYGGFGNWANVAQLTGNNTTDFEEADQIAISALN